jgi:uracil-DNA glycosylase
MPIALPVAPASPFHAHRAALAGCRRCAAVLPAGVRPVLPEVERPLAMLVGQAPGPREATDGRPFLGRSGRTLFGWLAQVGLPEPEARRRLHIAAITRCYPGPHPGGRGDRVAGPAERAACAPWLDAELALLRPSLIVPVGRLAIDRFLGGRPLAALVGAVHEAALPHGRVRVLPLPHPSGASGWLHGAGHRTLLERALGELGSLLAALGVQPVAADPVAERPVGAPGRSAA